MTIARGTLGEAFRGTKSCHGMVKPEFGSTIEPGTKSPVTGYDFPPGVVAMVAVISASPPPPQLRRPKTIKAFHTVER
jgi:hypothetical protein